MSYLLFQMALYMLVTLLLGFLLGWYIWGNLFQEGNVLGKLGFSPTDQGGAGSSDMAELGKLRARTSELEDELSRMNAHRAKIENDLDACQSRRSSLEAELATLKTNGGAPEPANVFAAPDIGTKPQGMSKPRGGSPDDLKQIKGIGPKLEKMLHGMGFFHFDQIAKWGKGELAWVDENLEGFKGRASRDKWIAQAKKLS